MGLNVAEVLKEAQSLSETYTPSLYDVTRWFDTFNFARDYENRLTLVLGFIVGGCNMGIESLSGSGKTAMADAALKLLPHKGWVWEIGLGSRTSIFYEMEKINRCKRIYIPELQKVIGGASGDLAIEILKNFGEGKDIDRPVTTVYRGGTKNFHLKCKPFLYTLATENITRPDQELSRRVMKVYTDISREQTKEVLRLKALSRFVPDASGRLSPPERLVLIQYVKNVVLADFDSVLNPFALYIAEHIPDTFVQSRSCIDFLYNLMEASARWCAVGGQRLVADNNVFISLADVYMVDQIYSEPFMLDIIQVPPLGKYIVKIMLGESYPLTVNDLQIKLSEGGVTMKIKAIKEILSELIAAGYVVQDEEMKKAYILTSFFKQFGSLFNWRDMYESAREQMRINYEEYVDDWDAYNRTAFPHPITGKKVEFEDVFEREKIEQGSREVSE